MPVFCLYTAFTGTFQIACGDLLQGLFFPGDCCEQVCICSFETENLSLCIYKKSGGHHTNYKSKSYLFEICFKCFKNNQTN